MTADTSSMLVSIALLRLKPWQRCHFPAGRTPDHGRSSAFVERRLASLRFYEGDGNGIGVNDRA
jgi:hypothetical protein